MSVFFLLLLGMHAESTEKTLNIDCIEIVVLDPFLSIFAILRKLYRKFNYFALLGRTLIPLQQPYLLAFLCLEVATILVKLTLKNYRNVCWGLSYGTVTKTGKWKVQLLHNNSTIAQISGTPYQLFNYRVSQKSTHV